MTDSAAVTIREHRLAGRVVQAMQLATEELRRDRSAALMAEAIRLLILTDEHESAAGLYTQFTSDPLAGNNLEPEALVRLALQMGRSELLKKMPVPAGPAWLVELLTSGEDRVGAFEPLKMDISVVNGPSIYVFHGQCPHCGHLQTQAVRTSLLVLRRWPCVSCFGLVVLDQEAVLNFIETNHHDLLSRNYFDLDAPLLEHLRPLLVGQVEAEDIITILGQEYTFLLNEIVVRHNTSDMGGGGA